MSATRKFVFSNEQIYHVYNRGVEKRQTFMSKRDFQRATDTINYYRFMDTPKKFSDFLSLPTELRSVYFDNIHLNLNNHVEIIAYCLMPNHFHFLVKQKKEHGITQFMTKFTNSYTKYFNKKYKRVGPLFQGIFKAVHIENDEQLVHVCRYILLNPVTAYLVEFDDLQSYQWSSYNEYFNFSINSFCNTSLVKDLFPSTPDFKQFLFDQVSYARQLDNIKHLTFEHENA
jgi:putative transposase